MKSWIIHDTPGFFVVNKPAGVLSQKDKSGHDDLAALLQKSIGPFPFLAPVHRLDRNTSGIILLAKSAESARELTEWLQNGQITRRYLALVKGDPGDSGRYEFPLRKNEQTNEVFVHPKGDKAVTNFRREQKLGNASLVKVELETGRSHQIRAHFAHAGHALIGDKKYAKKPWSEIFVRPALHSAEIEMPGLRLKAPIPNDFKGILIRLGGK
jgi:RluA family pseudouridine synthase